MKKIIKYLTLMLIMACSSDKNEVQKLENMIGIVLPKPYKVLVIDKESIGADYSTKIEIEFDNSSFDILSKQIINSSLFNSEYSAKTANSLMTKLNTKNIDGFWVSKGNEFNFVHLRKPTEPITCVINKKTRKLVYIFSHI